MRVMDVPPFPRQINIPDLENLLRTRLGGRVVMWPDQAIALLGYMCHPNNETARHTLMGVLRSWPDHSGSGQRTSDSSARANNSSYETLSGIGIATPPISVTKLPT